MTNETNPELFAAAQAYFDKGYNVFTIKVKQPLAKWEKWQAERQSQDEFNSLNFFDCDSIGVICGTRNGDGLHLAVIDFDVKNLPLEAIEKGKQTMKELPLTAVEESPSGGQHWIYYTHCKPKTLKSYHNEAAIELLGEHTYCAMAPSRGYKKINDYSPTVVTDLEDSLLHAFYKAGVRGKTTEAGNETWFGRKEGVQPYGGKDPNCIRELAKGAKEGLRNEHGIRLASYYGNCKQYQTDACLKILKTWNKFNEPQLETKEVETLLKSALQGNYVYGCNDSILKSVCKPEGCPLAKMAVKEATEEEKVKAERLLSDPKLLDYVLLLGRKHLIGEDNLLKQNFIFIASGQTRYPISEIITGHSGSGKNESIRAISPLIPENWLFEFTTSTPEAIKYIPEEFKGTIIVYELAGIQSETGTLGLRSIGEGKGIKTIYPMRDETTGKMTLGETQTNAKNFISTDSGLDIAADLYRRVFKNSMNDSLSLTKRVCAKKMRDASIPESLRAVLFPEQSKIPYSESDFRNALGLLDLNLEVVVFPPTALLGLIDLANKKEQEVALRTQIERILNVIKILALIQQRQRISLTVSGNTYVIADCEDVELALKILETSIIETVTRIEKRQKEALEIIEKNGGLNKNQLAEKLRCASTTAARILKTLAKNGYLREVENVKPFQYELVDDRKRVSSFVLLENISRYEANYPSELKSFLNRSSYLISSGFTKNFNESQENIIENSIFIPQALKEKYWQARLTSEKTLTNQELKPNSQNDPESLVFLERTRKEEKLPTENKSDKQPAFYVKNILIGEKCEACGELAVTKEIITPMKDKLRRCENCLQELKKTFNNAVFTTAFPDSPDYFDEEVS